MSVRNPVVRGAYARSKSRRNCRYDRLCHCDAVGSMACHDEECTEDARWQTKLWCICTEVNYDGYPLTEQARTIERIRRVNYGNLEVEVTVDDPKAYTKPWTRTVKLLVVLDTDLSEYICNENEKDLQHRQRRGIWRR